MSAALAMDPVISNNSLVLFIVQVTACRPRPNHRCFAGLSSPSRRSERCAILRRIGPARTFLSAGRAGAGFSDPYAVVYFEDERRQTRTVWKSLNPVWNERIEFKACRRAAAATRGKVPPPRNVDPNDVKTREAILKDSPSK